MDQSPYEQLYSVAGKLFQYEPIQKVKNALRPVKHAIFGKRGIYRAIDVARSLEVAKGSDVFTVFDIGAAVGEYAVHFLKSFPKAKIYCFEPMADSYAKLAKAVAPRSDRVVLNKMGFFHTAGRQELHVLSYRDASSILETPEEFKQAGHREVKKETIIVEQLDDFVKKNNIARIEFLKIDVEGVEKEVLEGGIETLKNKVDNIFIEISLARKGKYSANYIEVLRMINEAGFALLDVSDNENFFFFEIDLENYERDTARFGHHSSV